MSGIVFITGARGFIGKVLVRDLLATGRWRVRALTRSSAQGDQPPNKLTFIFGNLLAPVSYRSSLEGVDTVIHLAAVTGRAARNEYEQTNVEGTKCLLRACKEAGVGRFLYVSTIAATYPDQRHYLYAQSKARAEALVRESGIPYTILRPTVVIGSGSLIWHTLSSIAKLPVIPLPNGGRVQLQPIDVDDLVNGIELVLSRDRFEGETLDLGGPNPISVADFMRATHKAFYDKEPHFISFPLAPIRSILAFTEPVLRPILPVTAGQLALFANRGTASHNWLQDGLKEQMHSVQETIATLVAEKRSLNNRATREDLSSIAPRISTTIDRECDIFTRYLVSQPPTQYIQDQYKMALRAFNLAGDAEFAPFDRRTLNFARRNVYFARVADGHCAIFHRRGVLRRKLILLIAILEHAQPTATLFDRPKTRGSAGIIVNLLIQGISFSLSILVGIFLLLPSQLLHTSCLLKASKK
jgi:nucleoside-diphosphate-sugar epimerase